jgi:hypothetical protein
MSSEKTDAPAETSATETPPTAPDTVSRLASMVEKLIAANGELAGRLATGQPAAPARATSPDPGAPRGAPDEAAHPRYWSRELVQKFQDDGTLIDRIETHYGAKKLFRPSTARRAAATGNSSGPFGGFNGRK